VEALTLTPEGREELHKLLLGLYTDWDRLEIMLSFKLDKSLGEIASQSQGMHIVVFRVIQQACRENWCHGLVSAVIKDRPEATSIRQWADTYLPADSNSSPRAKTPPDSLMALDTSFFDLTELRNAVEEALAAGERGLFGFGIPYPDLAFVSKVCEWLPYCIGDVQRKEPLNLKPEFAPVARHIKQVVRYQRDLMTSSVVCPVLAEGVPPEIVETFWRGVSSELTNLQNSLILVITTYPGAVLPVGVISLPAPKFTASDITVWAREIVRQRHWPPFVAKLWSSHIVAEAQDGTGLDVRAVYEAMDRSIREIRSDPNGFRARLEQGSYHAYATSR
jgi:hypothetical protein